MNRTATARRNQRGFTLVEVCVSVGICAALLGQAAPAMTEFRQQRALMSTSEALSTDLRFARSEAVRSQEPVFFRISGKGAQACYILHTGVKNDCDCADGQAQCKSAASQVIKAEWLTERQSVRIQSNAETLQFQHRQGLVTQTGRIELALPNGNTVRHVVAITGRARTCAVGQRMGSLPKCK
jgi:Tfp pilus assembly protein FimT